MQPILLDSLQPACDAAIKAFKSGYTKPDELSPIQEWLENEMFDNWCAQLDGQFAIDLGELTSRFNDQELLSYADDDADSVITDERRVQWGRELIDKVVWDGDSCALDAFALKATDGSAAYLGCLIEARGQAGLGFFWLGLFTSCEELLSSLMKDGRFWIIPYMGDIPDSLILARWGERLPS